MMEMLNKLNIYTQCKKKKKIQSLKIQKLFQGTKHLMPISAHPTTFEHAFYQFC